MKGNGGCCNEYKRLTLDECCIKSELFVREADHELINFGIQSVKK